MVIEIKGEDHHHITVDAVTPDHRPEAVLLPLESPPRPGGDGDNDLPTYS